MKFLKRIWLAVKFIFTGKMTIADEQARLIGNYLKTTEQIYYSNEEYEKSKALQRLSTNFITFYQTIEDHLPEAYRPDSTTSLLDESGDIYRGKYPRMPDTK